MMKIVLGLLFVALCLAYQAPIGRSPGQEESGRKAARNTCQYYATDADMNQLGLLTSCSNWCTNYFGRKPDGVHVNVDDGEPYKCCSEAETNEVTYGSLVPKGSSLILINSTYDCTTDQTSKTWTINTQFQDTYTQSTTTIVSFQEDISYTVKCPGLFKSTFEEDYSFSSQHTTTDQDQNTITYTDQTTVATKKGCSYTYTMTTNEQTYSTTWYVPICLDGYCRCNYNKPIEDPNNPSGGSHYLWYVLLTNFAPKESQRCINQKGTLNSVIADITATSSVTVSPPSCQ